MVRNGAGIVQDDLPLKCARGHQLQLLQRPGAPEVDGGARAPLLAPPRDILPDNSLTRLDRDAVVAVVETTFVQAAGEDWRPARALARPSDEAGRGNSFF